MRALWHHWLRFEAWLLDGLWASDPPRQPHVRNKRPNPRPEAAQSTASSGTGRTNRYQQTRSSRRETSAQRPAADHLPFDLVAAYISIGLPHESDKLIVRQRLRQLMKEAHPDRHPPAEAERAARQMRELTRARDTLRRYGRLP